MAERDGHDEALLSISEMAGLLGTSTSALRYYEREGLVKPQRTKWSNYRGYGLMELFELTDIVHYRNAGLPVKDLPRLFSSPVVETLDALDAEIDRKLDELEELRLSLSAATMLAKSIRRRMTLGTIGWQQGTAPDFKRIVRFDTLDRELLGEYLLRRDALRYISFFASADEPKAFIDCACTTDGPGETVWQARKGTRYVEFLLTTAYGETGNNDLAAWRDRFAAEGIEIGNVVAEYLTYDIEPETGQRIDCYDAWSEVL